MDHKHSKKDDFCAVNCNPICVSELYKPSTGEWVFNSSVAEQTNVWTGKFLPIVREMTEVHFNFFMDEMIIIYNEFKEQTIRRKGHRPRLIPIQELELPRVLVPVPSPHVVT